MRRQGFLSAVLARLLGSTRLPETKPKRDRLPSIANSFYTKRGGHNRIPYRADGPGNAARRRRAMARCNIHEVWTPPSATRSASAVQKSTVA